MKLTPFSRLGLRSLALSSVGFSGSVVAIAVAFDGTPKDARRSPSKNLVNETRVVGASNVTPQVVTRLENPLTVAYKVGVRTNGSKDITVTVGNDATGYVGYQVQSDAVTGAATPLSADNDKIDPESFVRMRGTQRGVVAIAQALAKMVADQPLSMERVKISTCGKSWDSEGIAFFEARGVVHLVSVRFVGDDPVFDDFGFVATGCSATVPSEGCACSASGLGAWCKSGTTNGVSRAKCKDDEGTMNCTGGGGSCGCADLRVP